MQGRVRSLANVYTLSFLCVMALFAFGNMMLKYKRGRIRLRPYLLTLSFVLLTLSFVTTPSFFLVRDGALRL